MGIIANATYREGVAYSPDGAMYVTPTGTSSITGGTIAGTTFSTASPNTGTRTVLAMSGIPLISPGSFSMGNNGAITLGTVLISAWPNAYIYMLAGDIAAGVPAAPGWYYCTFSTTTAGVVFNNTYTTGVPTIPTSPTAFVTTGPGARTGDTAAEVAQQYTIPALTSGSQIITTFGIQSTNNANAKAYVWKLGATTFHTLSGASITRGSAILSIQNAGATNKNIGLYGPSVGIAPNAAEVVLGAVDTSVSTTLSLTVTKATATDNVVLVPQLVELAY